jgi:hypothetical protein
MERTDDLQGRIQQLREDLEYSINGYKIRAIKEYKISIWLSRLTATTGILASTIGMLGAPGKIVGIIALLPVVLSTIAINLKFQDKANWYYRKKNALSAFRRELMYQLPENHASDIVSEISKKWTELDNKMDKQWEKEFAFPWTDYLKTPRRPSSRSTPPNE